jgi:hypothetical protein
VRATYDLMVALLEEINARPDALTGAVAASEAGVAALAQAPAATRRVPLFSSATTASVPFEFKGYQARREPSAITGGLVPHYTAAPWDTLIPLYRELSPTLEVTVPAGYVVPQEWTPAIEAMQVHGVRFRRFAQAWTDSVDVQRLVEWSAATTSFEGHRPISVTAARLERRLRTFRAGDYWVPCDQRAALVALNLFEAQAPDGLTYWNVFDTVLEPKEYADDYVMEPIARQMLASDPALAKAFAARLAADTSFARNPAARVDFFYRRSRWADPEYALLPVVRALRPPPSSVLAP